MNITPRSLTGMIINLTHDKHFPAHGTQPEVMRSISHLEEHCASSLSIIMLSGPLYDLYLTVPIGRTIGSIIYASICQCF